MYIYYSVNSVCTVYILFHVDLYIKKKTSGDVCACTIFYYFAHFYIDGQL